MSAVPWARALLLVAVTVALNAVVVAPGGIVFANASATPADLRADAAKRPLGIDSARPRLSWRLQSERRGARQNAFRVIVTPLLLAQAGGPRAA